MWSISHRMPPSGRNLEPHLRLPAASQPKAYGNGATVYELARLFAIHRSTVSIVLERRGEARRRRLLDGERLLLAKDLYTAGNTLAQVGLAVGVSRSTVALTLTHEGLQLRRRTGR